MKTILYTTTILTITTVFTFSMPNHVLAENEGKKLVDSIQSVAQVKKELKQAFETLNQCNTGGCFNNTTTYICELVGALDVKVDGKIVERMSGGSDRKIPISTSDLKLMKKIFTQCKPTNYQYWNWETILHVTYSPTDKIDREIRSALGVSKPK
jgi:hypothetical protein